VSIQRPGPDRRAPKSGLRRLFGSRIRDVLPYGVIGLAAVLVLDAAALQLGFGLSAARHDEPLGRWFPAVLAIGGAAHVIPGLLWRAGRGDAALWSLIAAWYSLTLGAQIVAPSAGTMAIVAFAYGLGIVVSALFDRPPWVLIVGAMSALAWIGGLFGRHALVGDWAGEPGDPQLIVILVPPLLLLALAKLAEQALRAAQRTLEDLDGAMQSLEHYNEALVHARDQAESANRAKSAFLASMSHELRTPLNAIIGYSELVLEAPDDVESVRQDVTQVSVAGHHLLSLVNDVLDVAAIEAGKMELALEEVEVRDLLEGIVAAVQPLVSRRNNELETVIDADLQSVWVDPRRFRQVVINLVSNAAKFTRDGRIGLRARKAGRGCAIDVQDTGPGIAPDRIERIFEPFVREGEVSQRQPGTGLGLTIARDLVQLMGGRIAVESELGEGTRFTVWLPSRRPSRTTVRSSPRSLTPSGGVP